ncbi:prolipoprotein diacylglyceryl transferase [Lampropedia aestuarii]|uniref:Phosphatidylglycerol--prolipoprotein diacylglyceryl transferase n=1 Tax=Lampropedia aestuarii TaxID=2562762 RepID=A0A4S5BRZ6_9BURK|nr:prolipoprotein diacylglyceryl transferase [Lampropedia aestuarii]MDH5858510.1 prolipoprotein diacylglyceryl transferase [Lampropedia aestuarii]THJ34013.1 prolipoprotein diacylglyceryl transferase [Lampropedia aestuarii]
MLMYPEINPIALQIGPLAVHWYGLTYLVGFILFVILGRQRLKHPPYDRLTAQGIWNKRDVEDLLFIGVICIIVGGRLGYVLFYKPGYYFANPLEIVMINKGGMAFHGALIGSIVAMIWFCVTRKRPFWQVADFVAPCVPLGFAAGRIGNFINGELWGRFAPPDLPWGMVFPQSGSMLARHPSQIYQFLLEGVLLFILVWMYARKEHAQGRVAAVFLMGYGALRFIAEFFREPDDFLGLLSLGMSMGQWLCIPMIAAGAIIWVWAGKRTAAAH